MPNDDEGKLPGISLSEGRDRKRLRHALARLSSLLTAPTSADEAVVV